MKRIGIFGGSFDPPHVGHVLAVKYILSIGAVDEVIVVPVFEHAFHKPLTSFEVRMSLVELAFLGEPKVLVSGIERTLPRPNYSLYTVRALATQNPGESLRLVVGADVLHDIDKWHKFDELAELAPLLILGRAGVPHADAPLAVLPQVSSSEIRELLLHDESVGLLAQLLPKAVLDFILEQRLYGAS